MTSTQNINKITFASAFGTFFEWYDFLIFGTAAALVFNKLFFPTIDPVAGMLAAMLTFAVGFIARPVGGIVFGHFGDKYGRKNTLMATMLLMGIATFTIGLLPTYETIGIWAPIALIVLRILQGIAFGGEWGGASTMILEHAPEHSKGFYGSFIQIGYPLGLLAATGVFALMTRLPQDQFLDWGWRIPFLISIVLVGVGSFIRYHLSETPVFEKLKNENAISKNPLLDTVVKEPKSLLIGIGLKITEVTWAYLLTVFCVIYAVNNLGFVRSDVMNAVLLASAINILAIPFFGYLSDIVGRKIIYIVGSVLTILLAYPIFSLLQSGYIMTSIITGMVLGNALMMAPLSAYLPELFKSSVRFTGASFGCQIAAAIGGGIMPIAATALAVTYTSLTGVAVLMIVLGTLTLVSALFAKKAF